jgi:hypothetical protein
MRERDLSKHCRMRNAPFDTCPLFALCFIALCFCCSLLRCHRLVLGSRRALEQHSAYVRRRIELKLFEECYDPANALYGVVMHIDCDEQPRYVASAENNRGASGNSGSKCVHAYGHLEPEVVQNLVEYTLKPDVRYVPFIVSHSLLDCDDERALVHRRREVEAVRRVHEFRRDLAQYNTSVKEGLERERLERQLLL